MLLMMFDNEGDDAVQTLLGAWDAMSFILGCFLGGLRFRAT